MPSQISIDAGAAFLNDTKWKRNQTEITFEKHRTQLLLHDNLIAQKVTGRKGKPVVEIRNTYQSGVTQDRLNGILYHFEDKLRVVWWKDEFLVEKYSGKNMLKPMFELSEKWVSLHTICQYYDELEAKREAKPNSEIVPRVVKRKIKTKVARDRKGTATLALANAVGISETQAREVLQAFSFDLRNLAGASASRIERLEVQGIGIATSKRIIGSLQLGKEMAMQHSEREKVTSPADAADLLMPFLRYETQEVVTVLCLDTKGGISQKGVITDEDFHGVLLREATPIFKGTLNACNFHPREIFRFAIDCQANSLILAHNHPSGDPQPSSEDIRATKQLIEAGNNIGIKVLDHIVIGDGIFVSLKEDGHI